MQTDRRKDGRIDITKLIVAYCNFTNAPKMHSVHIKYICVRLILLVHKVTIRTFKWLMVTSTRLKAMFIAL
jgi:hypothetical protein